MLATVEVEGSGENNVCKEVCWPHLYPKYTRGRSWWGRGDQDGLHKAEMIWYLSDHMCYWLASCLAFTLEGKMMDGLGGVCIIFLMSFDSTCLDLGSICYRRVVSRRLHGKVM